MSVTDQGCSYFIADEMMGSQVLWRFGTVQSSLFGVILLNLHVTETINFRNF